MIICLEQGAHGLQMVPADAIATPSSLASLKPSLVEPFWCQLTQVVVDKMPLNGCLSVRVARMEAEAIDIEAEERRANERVRQIGAQKEKQLKDLGSRAQVCTAILTFNLSTLEN